LAVECLNYGLQVKANTRTAKATIKGKTDEGEIKLLGQSNGNGGVNLLAAYSASYARVPDLVVCEVLNQYAGDWKTPPARPHDDSDDRARPATKDDLGGFSFVREGETIAPAGVYRDDRSLFAFLVNPSKVIDNGPNGGGLYQGLIAMNSEVGFKKLRLMSFLFSGVCGNHYIHNASEINTVEFVHKGTRDGSESQIVKEWRTTMIDAITKYGQEGLAASARMLDAARVFTLGKDKEAVVKAVANMKDLGIATKTAGAIFDTAEQFRDSDAGGLPPTNLWSFVCGLTRYSQGQVFANVRHDLDYAGSLLLNLATAS
jgi:hypothetical protein